MNRAIRIRGLWIPFAKNGEARSAKMEEMSLRIQFAPIVMAGIQFLAGKW
jgi:hypothetical protein